jgi:hypothetical protein
MEAIESLGKWADGTFFLFGFSLSLSPFSSSLLEKNSHE